MQVKTLAKLHIASILLAALFMAHDTPIITGYIVWSFFLWIVGYPLYYVLGEPGWDKAELSGSDSFNDNLSRDRRSSGKG